MSWLTNWQEAAAHPQRTLAFVSVAGLVGGGLIGYYRFDRSWVWATTLGVAFAAILTVMTWRNLRDPGRTELLRSRNSLRNALRRVSVPFVVLLVAFLAGMATSSEQVFVIVLVASLAMWIGLSLTVWR